MHINDLINPAMLAHEINEKFIRVQTHPTLPLKIYNYTEKAQFSKHWNKATLLCRGLIVHDNGTVVARPFPKFFNFEEPKPEGSRHQMSLDEPVVVTDKLDGSLGILYRHQNMEYIATRGSFTSDQAQHATKVYHERYLEDFGYRMNPRLTYLFEIVYPENRIVVDYQGLDDIVLIGAVDIDGGFVYGPEMVPGWPGPRAKVFPYRTLREAVQAKPRPGKEGLVVRSLADSLMVKLKQEDYVSLHRVVTGLNEKEIWRRAVKADLELPPEIERLSAILQDIPDEMHEWVTGVASELHKAVHQRTVQVLRAFYNRPSGPKMYETERSYRARCAVYFQGYGEQWLQKALWIMYDGKSPGEFLWKMVEPRGDKK